MPSFNLLSTQGLSCEGILNITNAQCSAIGEALVPATTISRAPGAGPTASSPLEAATVSLVFPTGNVKGSVPQFSNNPDCTVSILPNLLTPAVTHHGI